MRATWRSLDGVLPRNLYRRGAAALALALLLAVAGAAAAEPPPPRAQLTEKPSGFWTSTRPARGGAYRYRMLGIGVALATATGLVTWRIVRRYGARTPAPTSPKAA